MKLETRELGRRGLRPSQVSPRHGIRAWSAMVAELRRSAEMWRVRRKRLLMPANRNAAARPSLTRNWPDQRACRPIARNSVGLTESRTDAA
jgi:hypothetical protein